MGMLSKLFGGKKKKGRGEKSEDWEGPEQEEEGGDEEGDDSGDDGNGDGD